ncbi:MAG: type III-A CRISPR-associated RAMP protein Csm4 [Lachnospiraceae bacterium]|jgi:CRISPR-associated protein Csm4|nr:type III-A CRISPR-associated RAMP protein Csm4 [Lachnospiraceae bacterium]
MKYKIIKIIFNNKVRFGIKSLEDTFAICHSDTLFSSIYIEMLNLCGQKIADKIVAEFSDGKMKISSAFPFWHDTHKKEYRLYLPKPLIHVNADKKDEDKQEKSLKKELKKINLINITDFKNYIQILKNDDTANLAKIKDDIYTTSMEAKVSLQSKDKEGKNELYSIDSVKYKDEIIAGREGKAGLYFIVGYEENEVWNQIQKALTSLQYTGIGGKKSIGYGKFSIYGIDDMETCADNAEKMLYTAIEKANESKYKMLISLLSPTSEEINDMDLENMYYSLIKRAGFIYSNTYAEKQVKKKEIYMFEEGSCFNQIYNGEIKDLKQEGMHSVYRNGISMCIGVDIDE